METVIYRLVVVPLKRQLVIKLTIHERLTPRVCFYISDTPVNFVIKLCVKEICLCLTRRYRRPCDLYHIDTIRCTNHRDRHGHELFANNCKRSLRFYKKLQQFNFYVTMIISFCPRYQWRWWGLSL